MSLFRPPTDDEEIARMEKDLKNMLTKNYDLLNSQKDYPKEAYLLRPEKIFATSYDKLNTDTIRINIGYQSNFSGYVNKYVRMNYEIIRKGSVLCRGVMSVNELPYSSKSNIKTYFFSSTKIIIFPVQNEKSVEIKCKKIYIERIGSFVRHGDKLITHDEFLEMMKDYRP